MPRRRLREVALKVFVSRVDQPESRSNQARGGPGTGPRETFSGRKRDLSSQAQPTTPEAPTTLGGELPPDATILAHRGAPAPEALAQISEAARIHDELRARGLRIRFVTPPDGRLEIVLQGASGRPLRRLSAAETADLAAGLAAL